MNDWIIAIGILAFIAFVYMIGIGVENLANMIIGNM